MTPQMPPHSVFFVFEQHNSEFQLAPVFTRVGVHTCAVWDFSSRVQKENVPVRDDVSWLCGWEAARGDRVRTTKCLRPQKTPRRPSS